MYGQPLEYAYRVRRRPAVVTAVGVLSILVGCASVLACGASILVGSGFYTFKRFSAAVPPPAPLTVPATTRPAGPQGLEAQQRRVVGTGLKQRVELSETRVDRLDGFLAQHGKVAFPKLESWAGSGPEQVLWRIEESGSVEEGDASYAYFKMAPGRLEVHDDRVTFIPADGGGGEITVTADGSTTGPTTAPTTLPATDVQGAIDEVQSLAGATPLNAQQLATLRGLLEAPGQELVLPSTPQLPSSNYVAGAYVDEDDGTAHVVFMNYFVTISPQGQVTSKQPTSAIPQQMASAISMTAIGLAIAEALLSAALAVFLIVAGAMTLRDSFAARRLHWIYVWIKIPLAIVAVLAWAWLLHGLYAGMDMMALVRGSAALPTSFVSVLLFVALSLGIAGLVYPVALIFALRSKAANDYYNMVT